MACHQWDPSSSSSSYSTSAIAPIVFWFVLTFGGVDGWSLQNHRPQSSDYVCKVIVGRDVALGVIYTEKIVEPRQDYQYLPID